MQQLPTPSENTPSDDKQAQKVSKAESCPPDRSSTGCPGW
jgi:hypothetical protein